MTTPETANTTTESSHPAEEVTSDSTQELALVNKEFIALLESQAKTHMFGPELTISMTNCGTV